MNRDQLEGTLGDAAGKVQEAAGKVIGSDEQRLEGINQQLGGQAQLLDGDVKQVVTDPGTKQALPRPGQRCGRTTTTL